MIERELTLVNRLGLHARAAAALVKTAGAFAAEIRIRHGDREADGKSIMSVMMLAAPVGTPLQVSADGEDEQAAMDALETLIAERFGEPN